MISYGLINEPKCRVVLRRTTEKYMQYCVRFKVENLQKSGMKCNVILVE